MEEQTRRDFLRSVTGATGAAASMSALAGCHISTSNNGSVGDNIETEYVANEIGNYSANIQELGLTDGKLELDLHLNVPETN